MTLSLHWMETHLRLPSPVVYFMSDIIMVAKNSERSILYPDCGGHITQHDVSGNNGSLLSF